MIELTLYSRAGCHLCDDMQRDLEAQHAQFDFALRRVDIDTDPVLQARYRTRIPVLAHGEHEICIFRLDREALAVYLRGAG